MENKGGNCEAAVREEQSVGDCRAGTTFPPCFCIVMWVAVYWSENSLGARRTGIGPILFGQYGLGEVA